MSEENEALFRRFVDEVLNPRNYDHMEEFVAPDFLMDGRAFGAEGYRQTHQRWRKGLPDLHIEIEHVVADGNLLAFHVIFSGTHKGTFHYRHFAMPPTGKRIEWRNIQFRRIENGMFVEGWHVNDTLGLMEQLGAELTQPAP